VLLNTNRGYGPRIGLFGLGASYMYSGCTPTRTQQSLVQLSCKKGIIFIFRSSLGPKIDSWRAHHTLPLVVCQVTLLRANGCAEVEQTVPIARRGSHGCSEARDHVTDWASLPLSLWGVDGKVTPFHTV
jgi:hypothetical protein